MAFSIGNWNNTPHNILVQVFSNLSPASRAKASATCQAWREAYLAPSLWNDIQLRCDRNTDWDTSKHVTTCCGRAFRKVSIFPVLFSLDMFDAHGYMLFDAAEHYARSVEELPELLDDVMAVSKYLRCLQIKFADDVMGSWGDDFDMDFFPAETLER